MDQDIRWQQRFTNFAKAFRQLEKFIMKGQLNELEEQGLIKAFEYTYELAWKTLEENKLNSILNILRTNNRIKEIILFGSRAKGVFDPGSDIDLAIKGEELTLNDIISLKTKLEELPILNKIDLVIYNRINEPALIEHINRVGIPLYKREPG